MIAFAVAYSVMAIVIAFIAAQVDDSLETFMVTLASGILWPLTIVATAISRIDTALTARTARKIEKARMARAAAAQARLRENSSD